MDVRLELQKLLIKHEGLRLKPYKDSVGKLTIGVGRNLEDVGLSGAEVMILLNNDIDRATADCRRAFPWFDSLCPERQLVILSLCFNMGLDGLRRFTKMQSAIKAGDYILAADEMLDSLWAKQVGRRAVELAEIMETGKL